MRHGLGSGRDCRLGSLTQFSCPVVWKVGMVWNSCDLFDSQTLLKLVKTQVAVWTLDPAMAFTEQSSRADL